MRALLTGSTGFLGLPLARRLARENLDLRLLVRNRSNVPADLAARCEVLEGSVEDRDLVRRAAQQTEVIFHVAALVRAWLPDRASFDRTNVGGLRHLLEAAGGAKFIYTSTFLVLDPQQPPCGDYHRTKLLAHEMALQSHAVILYPGVIFGPGPAREANFVRRMIDEYRHGAFAGLLAGGRPRWSFAYLEDVVEGHVAAWKRAAPGSRYALGGEHLSLREFYRILAEECGVQRRMVSIPPWVAAVTGRLETIRARWLGGHPSLTAEGVRLLCRDWVFSSEDAVRDLGYRITPFRQGLRATLQAMV